MARQPLRNLTCVVILIAVVALSACAPALPSREPDIRGTITSLTRSGADGSLLIEGEPGGTGDAKASVRITPKTKLFREVAGASPEPITLDDIDEGMQADAWFTGPVAESYPVQATGEAVLVSE